MLRKLTADVVYTVNSSPLKDGVVILDEKGVIVEIGTKTDYDTASLEFVEGALVPGLINTHCHLELSHMKGMIPTGTGLLTFIGNVVRNRGTEEEIIQQKLKEADQAMYEEGIVAVGDISNKTDTFECKRQSKIRYYTFIENFDFWQKDKTLEIFESYKKVYEALEENEKLRKSMSPHATYSMTPELFEMVNSLNKGLKRTISIHNQETPPENELFQTGGGAFLDFFKSFGIPTDGLPVIGKSAIHFVLPLLDTTQRILLVHNTLTTSDDIIAATSVLPETFWATCPNANLYIENKLPDYREFINAGAKVTIGTDSLTSNWQLSVLEEMKTILKYQSYLDFETVLQWATLNGAQALGWDNELGSLEVGKSPGIVQIKGLTSEGKLSRDASSKKIA